MRGLESLKKQIARLRVPIPEPEPRPPTGQGDLASLLNNQAKADGVLLPEAHLGGSVLLFLIKNCEPADWEDESEELRKIYFEVDK